ncbi:mechanosensitive ion channel [Legionella geestiana]|uniref:mechanosensitive ion channel domain-containing protein n=1 Tax=Legionella geestiana TaxID=45065 RepID=UPI0010929407|nr:mechanosensitive ion channel domain-containing protein [Legionella geestiana]QDQ40975.1 mechanosensitive ion channel [Legionella geestiana]
MPERETRVNHNGKSVAARLAGVFLSLVIVVSGLLPSAIAFASARSGSGEMIEYLTQEKMRLGIALNAAGLFSAAKDADELNKQQEENAARQSVNLAGINTLEGFLQSQTERLLELTARLKTLQQSVSPTRGDAAEARERINALITESEIVKKSIALIREDLEMSQQYQEIIRAERRMLAIQDARFALHRELDALRAKEREIESVINTRLAGNIALQNAEKSANGPGVARGTETRILLNNQMIRLMQDELLEISLQKKLAKADFQLFKNADLRTLEAVNDIYSSSITRLQALEASLKQRISLIEGIIPGISSPALANEARAVLTKTRARLEEVGIQQQTLGEDLENRQQQVSQQLSARKSLGGYGFERWPDIASEFARIPAQFYEYLKSLFLRVSDNYLWLDTWPAAMLWLSLLVFGASSAGLWHVLRRMTGAKTRQRLSGHLFQAVLLLFSRNLPWLAIAGSFWLVLWQCHVPMINYQVLVNLFGVWIVFRVLILIARMVLMERVSDASGHDVRLYHRLRWLLLVGGWITGLVVFSHLLPLGDKLQELFNRFFMVFLLAVSVLLWKSREVVSWLLMPVRRMRKRYFRNAITLLTLLAPLTLFVTAMTGLLGYVNLAWTMSQYEVYFLLVLVTSVLLRGVLLDGMELLSEWMVSSLQNGWVYIELVLKPLDKVLRLALFGLCVWMLFRIMGWNADSEVTAQLLAIARYPFVDISGVKITLFSTLEFMVLLSVVAWASKWTREFSWRWLYRNARDAGIRNSLSVFTQYAVILIGGFIAVRVLGFDFAGLSMVLGGLAVGMGFGLRDFASNVVGGLMLLIERPVREGDLVTIGTHEGRVAHIGIRSMRVSSWDNMEVVIPNAETFNKPFTNWTHQDSIVRTVVPVRVSRTDNPRIVQQLLLDALADIEEILSEPPPQALMTQIDDALIGFEVRYFINVEKHTRFEVRSKLLFSITEKFRAANIQPPIPPMRVELKDNEHLWFPKENAATE